MAGKGNRNATATRLANSLKYWEPIKLRIRAYLERHERPDGKASGAAAFMARKLGVENSQVHRWSCSKCEHDAEPAYSTGIAILLFLNEYEDQPLTPTPRHRKGCTKEMRLRTAWKKLDRPSPFTFPPLTPYSTIEKKLATIAKS